MAGMAYMLVELGEGQARGRRHCVATGLGAGGDGRCHVKRANRDEHRAHASHERVASVGSGNSLVCEPCWGGRVVPMQS